MGPDPVAIDLAGLDLTGLDLTRIDRRMEEAPDPERLRAQLL